MTVFWQFVVIGLASGAIYALLALGVVVIYRVSGVVNFAQGAFAVMAGFLYAPLISERGWSSGPAFALVVAVSAVAGVVIYWLAIRPLRAASQVTRVIATLAVFLILQGIATIKWAGGTVIVEQMLPNGVFTIGGVVVSYGQVVLVAISLLLTLLLWLGSRFTLAGIATRAVAENPRATAATGWSPDALATVSWALGCALGAAAGILIAPITGVTVGNMTVLAVAALTAALAGGFGSFPLTLLGAMVLGIGEAEISNYITLPGAPEAFPVIALVLLLVLRGRGLPLRGQVAEQQGQLGTGRIDLRVVVPVMLAVVLLIGFVFGNELIGAITVSLAFATILLSIVVVTGMTGQLSLGQIAFAGIGALVAARLVHSAGLSFVPAALIGVVVTVPIGLLFALPALRTRGMTLAIVTLALGTAVSGLLFENGSVIAGVLGTQVGSQSIFGWGIESAAHPVRYAFVCLAMLAVCMLAVANLRRGRVGRRLIAVRANERAAAALGVNVYAVKLYAFGLAAAIAAVGGILLAFQFVSVGYTQFDPFVSVLAVGYAVIGGVGFVAGPVLAAALAPGGIGTWVLDQFGTSLASYLSLIGGVLLWLMLLQNPNGMQSQVARLGHAMSEWRRRRRRQSAPPIPATDDVEIERVRPVRLVVEDLAVRFGGVFAVNGVSLTLEPGRVSGLIGPNGAGKTTVIDAITGFVRPVRGRISLDEQRIEGWPTHKRVRTGVARSFQALELFEGLSVAENILSASEHQDSAGYLTTLVRSGRREFTPAAIDAIREFNLEDDLEKIPSDLPYGRRRLVAIARAVASNPSVLLLDEPVAGLDDTEATEIAALVRGLAIKWGIAILLVEHDMNFVMSTCDDITVVDFGKQIAHGTPDEISRDPKVVAAYLGEPEEALVGGSA